MKIVRAKQALEEILPHFVHSKSQMGYPKLEHSIITEM
jgi:hypothetical protein